MEEKASVYKILSSINVNDKTEKKEKLTYLSWAWAWGLLKENYPDAAYTVYENADGWNYFTDGRTCWVKTGVTINGQEYIEYLPVMDNRNRSIPVDKVTSFDVNKTIQRSLTKACARHGLGLYIYAGEDLPDGEEPPQNLQTATEVEQCTEHGKKTDSEPPTPPYDDLPFPMEDVDIAINREIEIKNILMSDEWWTGFVKYVKDTFGTDNLGKLNIEQYKTVRKLAEKKANRGKQ